MLKVVIIIFILFILFLLIDSYIIHKRPVIGTIATCYFRIVGFNRIFKKGTFEKVFKYRKVNPEKIFPKCHTKNKLTSYMVGQNYVFELTPKKHYKKTIVYLHGGAFFNEITIFHVRFLDKLCSKGNIKIIIPCYSVVTKGNWRNAFELLDAVYEKVKDKDYYLMGDSAGGGLCVSYSQYLKKCKKVLPNKLILFSPWLDITMSNKETKKYAKIDPVLNLYGLKIISRIWANDINTKDYRVSPLFGNLKNLPEVFIVYADRELCYPDNKLFVEEIRKNGKHIYEIVGKGMNHIFPLYPIPDYYHVKKKILKFINTEKDA